MAVSTEKIYKLKLVGWESLPCGTSAVVEDFVPVDDEDALVTTGPDYVNLTVIAHVNWKIDGDEIVLSNPDVWCDGTYLRLGHPWIGGDLMLPEKGDVVYSDGRSGMHQPFLDGPDIYYTDDAPNARIYKNGKLLVDHWDDYVEVGNPWVDDTIQWGHPVLYFEARRTPAPQGWEIWKMDCEDKSKVADGANPATYDGKLYYGKWNGRSFDIAVQN